SSRQRQSQLLVEVRDDHFRCQSARRNMVGPPQAVDVAGQTFAPDRLDFIGDKAVKPTPCRQIAFLKDILPPSVGREKTYSKARSINHTHPAFSLSARGFDGSSTASCLVASRPGDRFPGRSGFFGFREDSSSCVFDG